jgi:hypothetical protein
VFARAPARLAGRSAGERSGPLLAPRLRPPAFAAPLERGRYPQFTESVNIIQIVCMMPLMLIAGLDGSVASAVLPTGGVMGGLFAGFAWRRDATQGIHPWTQGDSADLAEPPA